jgi:hypothetical protein
MYASVNTSRVRASCTIAGTNPRSSNFTLSISNLIALFIARFIAR